MATIMGTVSMVNIMAMPNVTVMDMENNIMIKNKEKIA